MHTVGDCRVVYAVISFPAAGLVTCGSRSRCSDLTAPAALGVSVGRLAELGTEVETAP